MIQEVAQERKKICDGCEWHSENRKKTHGYKSVRPDDHCVNCGCTLDAKQRCLSCECPLKYWLALKQEENGQNKENPT